MKHRTGMLLKRGSNYYCRWVVNGKVFMRSLRDESGDPITKKEEAETARVKLMAAYRVADEAEALQSVVAQLEGKRAELVQIHEERNPPLTIEQAWHAYLATPNRPDTGPTTLEKYRGKFQRFTEWIAKKCPEAKTLRDVTEDNASDYAQHLAGTGMAAATFNAHIGLLHLVWRVLRKKARTERNPWAEIGKKRVSSAGRRELTIEELRTICAKAGGELRTLLALGLYTGMRLGDCATLRWGEVDLVRGIIRRVPMKTARRNGKPVVVPIHPTLRAMLDETPEKARRDGVLPEMFVAYRRDSSAVAKMISKHFGECGIPTHAPGTGFEMVMGEDGTQEEKYSGKRAVVEVGFHSLRHSFVSLCRAANAPLSVVEAIVGHSSPAMTRHYTHTGDAAALAAVQSLPSIIGASLIAGAGPALSPARMVNAETVRMIAEKLTAKNWKEARSKLLATVNA